MPGYIRIFVISCAILVVSQCENQSITQQQSNVVHHVRAEQCSYDVTLQPLALGQEFQSATIGRIRHCKPSSRPSWELRHNITTYRPVNPRHIETWQFNYTPRGHCTHQLRYQLTMDSSHRQQLVRQRAVANSCLTRMRTFIETGDRKLNDIQVRFEELPNIFNKSEAAQSELELSDDIDHSVDRQQFEEQYFEVKAKFN